MISRMRSQLSQKRNMVKKKVEAILSALKRSLTLEQVSSRMFKHAFDLENQLTYLRGDTIPLVLWETFHSLIKHA